MKQAIILLGAAALLFASCTGNKAKNADATVVHPTIPVAKGIPRILFMGNSHTEYYVSLPTLFKEMCTFNKQQIIVDKFVTMSVDLNDIYKDHEAEADAAFAKTDADGNYYEMVVLQEKTPTAYDDLAAYKANVKMIVDKIKKNSPAAAIYIYEGMSFLPYEGDGKKYSSCLETMNENALEVMKESGNAGLFRIGDAAKDAYDGKEGYIHETAGKDNLRFGDNTLHFTNDGGFLEAVLLYATIFNKNPEIPTEMTFSTGTSDNDEMKKMEVAKAVSNPKALATIAFNNK